MSRTLFCVFLLVAVCFGQVQMALVKFRDCGTGEIESISIEPCPSQPCHFNQGDRANMSFTFTLKEAASSAQIKSTLRRGGLLDYEIEVPEMDPNVCRDGNALTDWGKVECPLEKDKRYTFVISRVFPVSSTFNIFRYSKVRFLNEDGRMIACADMRLQFQRIIPLSMQTSGLKTTSINGEQDNDKPNDDKQERLDRDDEGKKL